MSEFKIPVHFSDLLLVSSANDDVAFEEAESAINDDVMQLGNMWGAVVAAVDANDKRVAAAIGEWIRLAEKVIPDEDIDTKEKRSIVKMAVYAGVTIAAAVDKICVSTDDDNSAAAGGSKAQKKAGKGKGKAKKSSSAKDDVELSPAETRETIIKAIADLLRAEPARLWPMGAIEEDFAQQFVKAGVMCLEEPLKDKDAELKKAAFDLIAIPARLHGQSLNVTVSLMHLLHNNEHAHVGVAELLEFMVAKFDDHSTVGNILREIGRMSADDMSKETVGVRSISAFLPELASRLPKEVLANVSLLFPHLGAESYVIRNGIVQTLGFLILKGFPRDQSSSIQPLSQQQQQQQQQDQQQPDGDVEAQNRTRDSLFAILEDRFRDITSYTRAKVLQTWQMLYEEKVVPLNRLPIVTEIACGRLEDKSAIVRKSALQLLSSLLRNNPFAPELKLSHFESQLDAIKQEMIEKINAIQQQQEGAAEITDQDVEKRRFVVRFLTSAIEFTRKVHEVVPKVCGLLGSKQTFDVTESIELLVTCAEFGIENVMVGIRRMLALVWAKETSIRDALIDAYKRLYLTVPIPVSKEKITKEKLAAMVSFQIAKNLIRLTAGATLSDLTSLEEVMCHFVRSEHIDSTVAHALWEIFSHAPAKNNGAAASAAAAGSSSSTAPTIGDRRAALMVLSMITAEAPEWLKGKAGALINIGLGEAGQSDSQIARTTCIVLQRLGTEETRLPASHAIVQRLRAVILGQDFVCHNARENWCGVAEQAINAIFKLCDSPDDIAACIVQDLASACFSLEGSAAADLDSSSVSSANREITCSASELIHFLFVVGHIAVKLLVYLEGKVRALKKRRNANEQQSREKKQASGDAIEDELGLNVVAAEERETEIVNEIVEKDIVMKNLLGLFAPAIVRICANVGGSYTNPEIRSAAVLALCKFACVSSEFCDRHLPLIFTILERTPEPEIRCNIIIALGDLCFRFPNTLDPWGSKIYARLKDTETSVRLHCLMVLTHLILHGMIKIKGQISEMIMCIEDKDERICDLARLFLFELSKKAGANPIYNLLPDIISHLTNAVSADSFKSILRHVVGYIDKDKYGEALIEKLCHRFLTTDDPVQWRNFAFAIAQLPISDRGLKKLSESSRCFADKLVDDEVFEHISAAIAKGRKFAKAEARVFADELEQKVVEIRNKHLGEEGRQPTAAAGASAAGASAASAAVDGDADRSNDSIVNKENASAVSADKGKSAGVAAGKKKAVSAAVVAKGKGKGKKSNAVEESESDISLMDEASDSVEAAPQKISVKGRRAVAARR